MTATPFEQLGGERVLRPMIETFVARVFDDIMIGFHFRAADRRRVARHEYELAARHLGATLPYTGKPLLDAHAPHPITGGQFDRRRKILEEVIDEANVPAVVKETWLRHVDALRDSIVLEARRCSDS